MHKVLLNGRKDKADVFTTAIKVINNGWNKILKTTCSRSCFPFPLRFKFCDLRFKTFLVAFSKQLRSVSYLLHFCLSCRLSAWKKFTVAGQILCNFVFVIFKKTCPHAQILLKM
jgi:hypothetical protein